MAKDGVPLPPGPLQPPTPPSGPAPRRVVLVGFGHVGRAFASRLAEVTGSERVQRWKVVAIVDSRGAWVDESGVDLRAAVSRKSARGALSGPEIRRWDARTTIEALRPDVVVEVSVSDPEQGEPGAGHILAALEQGADVVSSNKGPFVLRWEEIVALAERQKRSVRFGTTVGAIVPILETLAERLPAAEVTQVRAVLNGTTQFVLSEIARGQGFDQAVSEAQARGYAEPDPSRDLGGIDAAFKATLVHNVLYSPPIEAASVAREPLRPRDVGWIRQVAREGAAVAAVATITRGRAEVRLERVPQKSLWALPGPSNVFEIETRYAGTLVLQGRGAGPAETAVGLLGDLSGLEEATKGIRGPRPSRFVPADSSGPPARPEGGPATAPHRPGPPASPATGRTVPPPKSLGGRWRGVRW